MESHLGINELINGGRKYWNAIEEMPGIGFLLKYWSKEIVVRF